MFGYIRPLKDELKVREFNRYKACYCGLCHTLKEQYGAFARNILSYDFVFLAMLLWDSEEPVTHCARCLASPFKRKGACAPSKVLDICAGYSVILSYWKLRDSISDEGFWLSVREMVTKALLTGAFRKASAQFPAFAEAVRENMVALRQLETADGAGAREVPSLDIYADKFARITEALAETAAGDGRYRPLRQLLYHMGRTIYLLDACDDLEEDVNRGRFNPLTRRFQHSGGKLGEDERKMLKETVLHSCGLVGLSYELLPKNPWSAILNNIVYLGLPETCLSVLEGTWRKRSEPEYRRNGQYYE